MIMELEASSFTLQIASALFICANGKFNSKIKTSMLSFFKALFVLIKQIEAKNNKNINKATCAAELEKF